MKKWGILIGGLIWGFVLSGQAQTDMDRIFSSDNENIIYSGKSKEYKGSPIVFIEGISDKPQPKDWKDELKIKLFGSMELPKNEIQNPLPPLQQNDDNIQKSIKINTMFGKEKDILFVPHTNEWNFIIQVLNDDEISIQEDILFIKTADVQDPVRNWPKQNLSLLEVKLNNQIIPPVLEEKEDELSFKLPVLKTGVHRIHLSYLIKGQEQFSDSSAQIVLPLIQSGWSLPVNSLTGVILFPTKVGKSEMSFLFGKNKKEIKEAFEFKADETGALFFQNTHLIPAFSAIQLNLKVLFDSFIKKSAWQRMKEADSFIIFIVSLFVMIAYLMLNVIEVKITSVEQIVMKKKFFASQNSFINFIHRTGEIWIGLFLLFLCTLGILFYTNASFSSFEILNLILIPALIVFVVDFLVLEPKQRKIFLLQKELNKEEK